MPEKTDAPVSPLRAQVQLTRRAARELAQLSAAQRNQILLNAAQQFELRSSEILQANQRDVTNLDRSVAEGKASAALAIYGCVGRQKAVPVHGPHGG